MFHGSETWGPNTSAAAPRQWPLLDPLDLWHQRPRRNILCFTAPETWHWVNYGSPSQSAAQTVLISMCSVPLYVSSLSQSYWFPTLGNKEDLERCDPNLWRMMSVNVAHLALTHKAATYEGLVADIVWCCQPYRMGNGQHPNLNLDMDEWMTPTIQPGYEISTTDLMSCHLQNMTWSYNRSHALTWQLRSSNIVTRVFALCNQQNKLGTLQIEIVMQRLLVCYRVTVYNRHDKMPFHSCGNNLLWQESTSSSRCHVFAI